MLDMDGIEVIRCLVVDFIVWLVIVIVIIFDCDDYLF